jgi:glutamate carboxypeptidase
LWRLIYLLSAIQSAMTPTQWIHGQRDRLINRVTVWSKVNSGSHNLPGIERAGELIYGDFKGLEPETWQLITPGKPQPYQSQITHQQSLLTATPGRLAIGRKRPKAERRLLFFGHLDTVYSPEHRLQQVVLGANGTLIGPGVCDMKGGLAIMLCGLSAFEKFTSEKNFGWTIMINSDEEIGSPGSSPYFQIEAEHHRFGLGFEPALEDGALASNRKGSGSFTFTVHGKAAHSGRNPLSGRNALVPAAQFILACQQLNQARSSVFVNPGVVSGGTVANMVPDLAVCQVNVRTTTRDDEDWLRQEFQRLRGSLEDGQRYTIELTGGFTAPPKPLTAGVLYLLDLAQQAAAKIGIPLSVKPTGGTCDGNRLAHYGLANIDNLGACGGAIHSENEYLVPESLVERSLLFYTLLEELNREIRNG